MTPTTTRELRAAFATMLRGLTPTELPRRERGWMQVERRADVPGAEIRRFHISIIDDGDDGQGIQAPDAFERPATLRIYACYGSLPDAEVEDLISGDGGLIEVALQLRTDPEILGFHSSIRLGWEDENDEQGRRWGAHTYAIRYLARGTTAP